MIVHILRTTAKLTSITERLHILLFAIHSPRCVNANYNNEDKNTI